MEGLSLEEFEHDEAVRRLTWSVQVFAEVLGHVIDPLEVDRRAREAVAGALRLNASELEAATGRLCEALRLAPGTATESLATSIDRVELPLASPVEGLAIVARHGSRLEVRRVDGVVAEVDADDFARNRPASRWLTAAPAAPLDALAADHGHEGHDGHDGHHHHPTPGQRLAALAWIERDDLWVVFIYAAAVGLLSLATPIAVQSLVGSVAFGTLLQPIVVLSLLFLGALTFQAVLKALQTRVVELIQQRTFVRAALDLAWRLPRVRQDAEELTPSGVNKFFDVLTVQKTTSQLLTDGIATVLQIVIGLLVLGFYHPMLLAFDLVLMALVGAMVFVPFKRGVDSGISESRAKHEVAAWLQQLARTSTTFRGAEGADFALERADALSRRYLDARRRHFRLVFGQTVGTLALQVVASASLLGLGGWLVLSGELTLGQLIAAELIVASVTNSVAKAGKLLDSTYDLFAALEKVGHLLDMPIDTEQRGEPVPGKGGVKLVATGLPGLPSLEVGTGARVAVVAPPQTGGWLTAHVNPPSGQVTFNGVEAARARSCELADEIVLIRGDELFAGTVLENVALGRERVTPGEVRAALERVQLLEEVRELGGVDVRLDPMRPTLTEAQVLRLMIARAMAARPRLIVLASSLEVLPEPQRRAVVDALVRKDAPWTLVAIVASSAEMVARACQRIEQSKPEVRS